MIAVCDERRAVDFAANTDAEQGDGFVANKANKASQSHPAKIGAIDGFVGSKNSAEEDNQNDKDAGEILNPAKAENEAKKDALRKATTACLETKGYNVK